MAVMKQDFQWLVTSDAPNGAARCHCCVTSPLPRSHEVPDQGMGSSALSKALRQFLEQMTRNRNKVAPGPALYLSTGKAAGPQTERMGSSHHFLRCLSFCGRVQQLEPQACHIRNNATSYPSVHS